MGGAGGMRQRPGAWGHLGWTKSIRVAQAGPSGVGIEGATQRRTCIPLALVRDLERLQ